MGGAKYANDCPEFCRLMKKSNPTILPLSSYPSQEVLDRIGAQIAYIAPHHYTPDLKHCEEDLRNLTALLQGAPGCDTIRIAVTEWNLEGGWWGHQREKLETLDSALQNARYLYLLMRRSDIVEIACRSNMTNSMSAGGIETKPGGPLKRPGYYTMKLYAEHAKPIPHMVEGIPEGLDVLACASEDGKRLSIFMVNTQAEPGSGTSTFRRIARRLA